MAVETLGLDGLQTLGLLLVGKQQAARLGQSFPTLLCLFNCQGLHNTLTLTPRLRLTLPLALTLTLTHTHTHTHSHRHSHSQCLHNAPTLRLTLALALIITLIITLTITPTLAFIHLQAQSQPDTVPFPGTITRIATVTLTGTLNTVIVAITGQYGQDRWFRVLVSSEDTLPQVLLQTSMHAPALQDTCCTPKKPECIMY